MNSTVYHAIRLSLPLALMAACSSAPDAVVGPEEGMAPEAQNAGTIYPISGTVCGGYIQRCDELQCCPGLRCVAMILGHVCAPTEYPFKTKEEYGAVGQTTDGLR